MAVFFGIEAVGPTLTLAFNRSLLVPNKRRSSKARARSWKHKRRPLTIGRALLLRKVHQVGTAKECIQDIKKNYGIDVAMSTFCSWLDGWSAPSGTMVLSDCETYLKKSTRCCVSDWAGIQHESWWWKLVEPSHIVPPDIEKDPFSSFNLRPPE